MNETYILRVHRGTMFLPDDTVGGYEVYNTNTKCLVAIFFIGSMSQANAFYKAEFLCRKLNEEEEEKK